MTTVLTRTCLLCFRQPKDPYYDKKAENAILKKDQESKKLKQRQTYIKRVIVHQSFRNISYRESEKLMERMDQGEVVVRPSSKVRTASFGVIRRPTSYLFPEQRTNASLRKESTICTSVYGRYL